MENEGKAPTKGWIHNDIFPPGTFEWIKFIDKFCVIDREQCRVVSTFIGWEKVSENGEKVVTLS
jgi:hypothetical protein